MYVLLYGNGNPLQCSCLENAMDRGAWWAAVHGVTQSRTRLKRLSMHASVGEGNGNPLQCSCLENPQDRGARWAAVHGIAQSQTRLKRLSSSSSNSTIGLTQRLSGRESTCNAEDVGSIPWSRAATHSSILACKIPQTEEPGGLQSIESQRVGQD